MEQRLAALFASVGNALDSSTYTYSDSDYLVRKALVEFLDGENALVASARKIQDSAEVVDSVLNYVVSTDFSVEDPADWYRKAMRIVVEFSDFAFRNEMSEDSARYAALLPEGHPRALNSITLTASAQQSALAEWMSADPRLDEEASAQIRKLYSMSSDADELDLEFEYLKAEAMVASGKMPEDLLPLTAAFNLTRAQRSAISSFFAKFRRRDRKGRFAEEFGRLSLIFGGREGFFSAAPKIVGPGSGPDRAIVEFDGSDSRIPKGLYDVDATKGENVKAYLPTSAVKNLPEGREVVAEDDKQYAIDLDELLANKVETPLNWEKSGKGFKSKDGKFVAEPIKNSDAERAIDRARERGDDLIIAGVGDGDAFDPEASGGSFLIADAKGKSLGVAQDWAGIQEIAVANGADFGPAADRGDSLPFGADDVRFDRRMEQQGRLMQRPLGGRSDQAEPDLDQDAAAGIDKSKLSPSMIGEGYNFSKEGEDNWVQEGVGDNGESYAVSRDAKGRWVVSERSGSEPDNLKERDLESFDNALEAFEYANEQGATPADFDEAWVNELMSEAGPDLDQDAREVPTKVMREMLSPEMAEKHKGILDEADQAIFNNDLRAIESLISRAAVDSNIPDEVYSALDTAREARTQRGYMAEQMIYDSSKEELEELLDDPEFSGWHGRIQDAIDQYVDLDQDAPTLSEKQQEAASGKQYAFLGEFLEERQLDPATEQAFKDAVENKNLNKAQASSLIALGRSADFKPGVDPNKPSERMLNSLQGYLSSKDLAPSEIKEVLDSLQNDGSRNNVDALLNKLRRKKDKPIDLNQGAGSLTRHSDGSYEWEDVYNNVNVNKTPNGWEVEYTSPDLQDDGASNWSNRIFNSEDEALAFAEELIKQNQDDNGYGRAADNLTSTADLDQEAKGTLADPATDKQWDFLQSLLDGKKIDNAELAAAVRSALADRNLTKGEVGAFIGQLRPLEDKPNVRREPSAKQIASIKRALLERDLTPEGRKELEDKLAAGLSFDEASELLNDLKKRPITLDGMTRLLDKLSLDQDMDTMRYLLDKPEYAEYYDAIRDTMRQLAIDTGDSRFQDLIDARDTVDLDQDVSSAKSVAVDALDTPEARQQLEAIFESDVAGENKTWTSPDGRVKVEVGVDVDDDGRGYTFADVSVDGENVSSVKAPDVDKVVDSLIDERIPVDLDQDVSSRSALNAEVDRLAQELDALDSFAVDGDELKDYVNEFYNSTRSPEFAAEMAASIYDMSRYVEDPNLKQRIRDLSARLDEELADRFGVAQAARVDGRDFLDLDEASAGIDSEREMFFETDVDRIAEVLDDRDSYGDNRSGGAEARISENEDGTFTARVDYDRDGEEQTFEDRDEAIAWAANQVSDYNSDVRPSSYGDSIDLDREAERARTDDQAAAFADRLDEIANDLDENRGDPRLANSLRAYGERIREMIANRDRQRESQVEEEPTTPETMDEMATDPELNPAGYAEYVATDLANKLDADSTGAGDPFDRRMQYDVPNEGTYVSNDGRVEVSINYDADTDGEGGMRDTSYFIVDIDGERVASGSLSDVDGVVDSVFTAVKDHFSKKA